MASDPLKGEKTIRCSRCGTEIRTKRDAHIRLGRFTLRQILGQGGYLNLGFRGWYLCEAGGCAPAFSRFLGGAEVTDGE